MDGNVNWISEYQFNQRDAEVMDELGDTLVKLGLIDIFDVRYLEDEEIEDDCRCGCCCYETVRLIDLHVFCSCDYSIVDELIRV